MSNGHPNLVSHNLGQSTKVYVVSGHFLVVIRDEVSNNKKDTQKN